jgi:hypothetical protein
LRKSSRPTATAARFLVFAFFAVTQYCQPPLLPSCDVDSLTPGIATRAKKLVDFQAGRRYQSIMWSIKLTA